MLPPTPESMNFLKMLLKLAVFAVVAVAALTIIGKVRQRSAAGGGGGSATAKADDKLSEAGFFLLSRDDAKNPNVTVMMAPNCPSDEAQRAQALVASLHSAGIPAVTKQGIEFTFTDPKDVERVNKYMNNVANPLVLVRGWAKGNPTADQVIAQYRAGK